MKTTILIVFVGAVLLMFGVGRMFRQPPSVEPAPQTADGVMVDATGIRFEPTDPNAVWIDESSEVDATALDATDGGLLFGGSDRNAVASDEDKSGPNDWEYEYISPAACITIMNAKGTATLHFHHERIVFEDPCGIADDAARLFFEKYVKGIADEYIAERLKGQERP